MDEDTNAFNKIIDAFRMPKDSEAEKTARAQAIEAATLYATEVPLKVMETALASMEVMQAMAKDGLQNSLSDAGVGVLCARAAVLGAYFNVKINAKDLKDRTKAEELLNQADQIVQEANASETAMIKLLEEKL